MLLQFNFKNYGPFKDEVSLNLEATSYSEYKDQIRIIGSKKLLPVSVIYGANASGKSFVYKAFRYMRHMVCASVGFDQSMKQEDENSFLDVAPFKLDKESLSQPSAFEIIITSLVNEKEVTYQYGFSILDRHIESEWLYQLWKNENAAGRELLKRNGDSISVKAPKLDGAIKAILEKITQPQTLVLSLAAKLGVEPYRSIFQFFMASEVDDFANLTEVIHRDHVLPEGIVENEETRNDCLAFLQTFEPCIKDLVIKELPMSQGEKKYKVFTKHLSKEGEETLFQMEEESAGTQKMFLLFNDLQRIINNGKVLFVDELNARLHPLLLRNILLIFLSKEKNPKNAQLIFTCHEPWLLRSKILRRDEIYFTNKDTSSGEATLYSLAEFTDGNGVKIRPDEDFEKNYLLGKYDGIPSLKPIDFLAKKEGC